MSDAMPDDQWRSFIRSLRDLCLTGLGVEVKCLVVSRRLYREAMRRNKEGNLLLGGRTRGPLVFRNTFTLVPEKKACPYARHRCVRNPITS